MTVCLCACTHALMLPPCCVPPFSPQNSVSTNPWKLRCSEPVAKPFPTEPRPRVCALLYTWLVPPVAGLPSLLGVGPSPLLGCLALPNRLLSTIITSAEPRTHQHTIRVWPVQAEQPSHIQHWAQARRQAPKTKPSSTKRAPVHTQDALQHCGLGWYCFWVGKRERGLAAVLLSSSPCSGGDVFIWAGMLQREAVRGNYLHVVLYRVPENPPCRDRALWYVTTSKPHIQWKQSVVEIAPSWCCVGKVRQICSDKTQPCTLFFHLYILTAK